MIIKVKEIILYSILKTTLRHLRLWISSCGKNGVHFPRVSSSAKIFNVVLRYFNFFFWRNCTG